MLSEFQKEQRKKSLGASDMAAVLGISRYKSAYDIWLEKTGKIPDAEIKSEAIEAGNRFERGVIAWASQSLGPLRRNVYLVAEGLPIHAILDARVVKNGTPVEAKTAGLFSPLSAEWGEEGTDEIPDVHMVQVQVQMLCSGHGLAHLAAFLAGRGFRMFDIERNADLQDIIKQRAVEFWDKCVKADMPPADSLPSIDIAIRRFRTPQKLIAMSTDVIQQWVQAREERDLAELRETNAKAMVFAALDDAEGSEPTPVGQITCMLQGKPGGKIDEKRLLAEAPEIYKKFLKANVNEQIRVLRYKKVKGK